MTNNAFRSDEEPKDSYEGNYKASNESTAGGQGNGVDVEKQYSGVQPAEPPGYHNGRRQSKHDRGDPFGDEENSEVKYRTMTWW